MSVLFRTIRRHRAVGVKVPGTEDDRAWYDDHQTRGSCGVRNQSKQGRSNMSTRRDFIQTCACVATASAFGSLVAGCSGEDSAKVMEPEVTGTFELDLATQPALAADNSAVTVPGTPAGTIFVTHGTEGNYYALSRTCTHQGCTVDLPGNGAPTILPCPCHGSRYNLDGTVAQGPAPRALQSWPVTLNGDTMTIDFA